MVLPPVEPKCIWRGYFLVKMNLKRKGNKRLPRTTRKLLAQPLMPNFCWSIDFMQDTLYRGRLFNAVDDDNREVLAAVDRMDRVLDRIVRSEATTRRNRGWRIGRRSSARPWPLDRRRMASS